MAGEQDTERELEPVMRNVLRQSAVGSLSACPDAETLAAWADGALRADEAAAFETHAADCAQCRAMMAAFIRTDVPAATAVTADSPEAVESGLPPVPFWRRWKLQWLVPIAATATAIALYVGTPEPEMPRPASSGPTAAPATPASEGTTDAFARRAEQAPPRTAPPAAAVAPPTDRLLAESSAEPPPMGMPIERRSNERARTSPSGNGPSPATKPERADKVATNTASADAASPVTGSIQGGLANTAPSAAVAVPAPVPVPEPTTSAGRALSASPVPPFAAGAAPSLPTAPPPPAPVTAAPDVTRRSATAAEANRVVQPVREQAPSPEPTVLNSTSALDRGRWRVAGGSLEHANESGRWAPVALPTGVDARQLTVVSSSGQAVWLVGRQGLVLASPDGRRFVIVPAPVSADLVQVAVRGATAATVTTADGRSFSTEDGGARWQAQ